MVGDRRAGWVGCNIALNRVPVEARISVVTASEVSPEKEVREQFRRVKPLKDISVKQRGWTLDVLNAIRRLDKAEFTTTAAYAFTRELEQLHPDNSDRHREQAAPSKITPQTTRGRNPPAIPQCGILRDAGLLLHVERGVWRLP